MKNVISLFLIIIGYLYGVSQDTEWYYNNPNTNTFDISTTEDFKGFVYLGSTKLLQKREMRKDIVIELSYKGFSRASDYS